MKTLRIARTVRIVLGLAVVCLGVGNLRPFAHAQCSVCMLKLVNAISTTHGNAAHLVWSDDGKTLFLANEEGNMSAVKIDVSDPAAPQIVAKNGDINFLWGVARKGSLLLFTSSGNGWTSRVDPTSFATVWSKNILGASHAIDTDGSRVFQGIEAKPGVLKIFDATGADLTSVSQPDGWGGIYDTKYDPETKRLYIASKADATQAIPGGLYIYDASAATLKFLGKIPSETADFAFQGTRLWRQQTNTLEAWDVANPNNPQMVGAWIEPIQTTPDGLKIKLDLEVMAVNFLGTRLYITYSYYPVGGGNEQLDQPAGFMIFDVSGPTPVLLVRQDWPVTGVFRLSPSALALSPDQTTLAVSYWAFGVRLYKVTIDQVVPQGMVATTGEAHDVYVDNIGYMHVFAWDNMQIFNSNGQRVTAPPYAGGKLDGGWKPFKDAVAIPGEPPLLMRIHDGVEENLGVLFNPAPITPGGDSITDFYFQDPYLYSVGESGTIYIHQAAPGQYTLQYIASIKVPAPPGVISTPLYAITKWGNTVWVLGPTVGVVAVDVTNPTAPTIKYTNTFTFGHNSGHIGAVAAQGRVYAGAGDAGVRIYDPQTFQHTGTITGLTVNFLDLLNQGYQTYLIVANYWYPALPDGAYVYDLTADPDAPKLVTKFPQDGGANFRVRVLANRIYRVPLDGVDILEFGGR